MSKTLINKMIPMIVVGLIMLSLMVAPAYAWFTVKSEAVSVGSSAKFDIEYKVEFDENDMRIAAPGDRIASATHSIKNLGNIPMVLELSYKLDFEHDVDSFDEESICIEWSEQYVKIGEYYYLLLAAEEEIAELEPLIFVFREHFCDAGVYVDIRYLKSVR